MGRYKWSYKYRVTIILTNIRGLMTPLITTHEPPSSFEICLQLSLLNPLELCLQVKLFRTVP